MSAAIAYASGLERTRRAWIRLSLARQYALVSLPVLIVGMLSLGSWMTRAIAEQVIQNSAVNASLYVNSFVTPELQGLKEHSRVTDRESRSLEALLSDTQLGKRIKSFKVWKPAGHIAYYTRHQLIGMTFEPTPAQVAAWSGEVRAELSSLDDDEDSAELGLGIPLLEVYMPVRERGTERVIAVAEFYQDARALEEHLSSTARKTWLVVAIVTIAMWCALFGIVHAGGRLIRRQGKELRRRVIELSGLLAQNEALRARVERATRRITELNEQFLRRLSADLHDGPAQALGLALLRLDALGKQDSRAGAGSVVAADAPGAGDDELERLRDTLQEALREIRQICRGLSLPELAGLSLAQTVERASTSHRRRTHTEVALHCEGLDDTTAVATPIKLTVYRVVQEALMNAFRHAQGRGQRIEARRDDQWVRLEISDSGPGVAPGADDERSERLGLSGLRDRVESLGGQFEFHSEPDRGTRVVALLPLEKS